VRPRRGPAPFEHNERLGTFDAVLAATAIDLDASALVSADSSFEDAPDLTHVVPDDAGVKKVLEG
jgi:uncharacterized protein